MNDLCEEIQVEYNRWKEFIGDEDPYAGQYSLGLWEVLDAHFLIADFFYQEGRGIGGVGPKDINSLHGCLYRQFTGYDGINKWNNLFDIAATIMYGLIKNHPFHDANKRTALLSTLFFLYKNNYIPTVSEKEFENFTVEVAEDGITKRRRYKKLLKRGDDPEILFISKWIKSKIRRIDKKEYVVTFRELSKILNTHGFDFGDSSGNRVDIIQIRVKKKLITREKYETREKIGRIGFPGMTRQISKADLKKVRELTGLTYENGYDSEVFYRGAAGLRTLITRNQDALKRLADR